MKLLLDAQQQTGETRRQTTACLGVWVGAGLHNSTPIVPCSAKDGTHSHFCLSYVVVPNFAKAETVLPPSYQDARMQTLKPWQPSTPRASFSWCSIAPQVSCCASTSRELHASGVHGHPGSCMLAGLLNRATHSRQCCNCGYVTPRPVNGLQMRHHPLGLLAGCTSKSGCLQPVFSHVYHQLRLMHITRLRPQLLHPPLHLCRAT